MKRYLHTAPLLLLLPLCACLSGRELDLLSPYVLGSSRPLLQPIRPQVEGFVRARTADSRITHISVYFQSLATGYWFGINETAEFMPASLLKTPLAMGILSMAEKDPSVLNRQLPLSGDQGVLPQEYPPSERLVPGKSYTVERLLRNMIVYSDNNATKTLITAFSAAPLTNTLADFGFKQISEDSDFITVKQYLMMQLSIYNATYLSPAMSAKLMGFLAEVKFDSGIAAGLPKGTRLAHKFGEREVYSSGGTVKQLHDCGIVYLDGSPYLLGIMTRGTDMDKQAEAIKDISALIYREVSSRSVEK